jgi:D-serine deaminase-like pyridoxal phosphate-dependent protein
MIETKIGDLDTPCLLLCSDRLDRNAARLRGAVEGRGVAYRPHLKTAKSIDVAGRILRSMNDPVTVSTLKEAEVFAEAGMKDIIYAVGISGGKTERIKALRANGIDIAVIVDSIEQARMLADSGSAEANPIPALIEIDNDGHRSGVAPEDAAALKNIASELVGGSTLRGVLTHCGNSYGARNPAELEAWALKERDAVLMAAGHLRRYGFEVPVVSVGSTPTALSTISLEGITEIRAGVGLFFDLVQAGVGVCSFDDIAISVLTTVIGHQRERGHLLVDAGWMAMSRDRGTAAQQIDQKYGVVCDEAGNVIDDLLLLDTNQEHGIVGLRAGSDRELPAIPIGARLRILPNHACATAAQHECYRVVTDGSPVVRDCWQRFNGW